MKLYMAHPLEMRHTLLDVKAYLDEHTTVESVHPFYAYNRPEVVLIDKLNLSREDYKSVKELKNMDFDKIVTNDLIMLESCDSVIAYVDKNYHSIGTICEVWHGLKHGKRIFIVTSNCQYHPWLKFAVSHSGGQFFKDFDSFKRWCKRCYGKT